MDLTPKVAPGRQQITGYGNGGFRVSGVFHTGPVLVLPELTRSWTVVGLAELSESSLADLFTDESPVELLLIGCGRSIGQLPPAIRAFLKGRGVAVDPMDTGAACRTYNVLLAEGRRVGAALIPVD